MSRMAPVGEKRELESTPKTVVLDGSALVIRAIAGIGQFIVFGLLAGRMHLEFCGATFSLVLDSVEEEFLSQEVKELALDVFRDIWLEVEEVEVGLVIDLLARGDRDF